MAVLFPVNMNNRGQNVLSVREKFHQLSREPSQVEFVGYHFRPSGNFLFIDSGDGIVEAAVKIGKTVIGLPCLARKFSELENIFNAVPANTKVTERGSVFLDTSSGLRKLIYVALSEEVHCDRQLVGRIRSRTRILSWPSACDVLCLYDRPCRTGDVGQVTNAVLAGLREQPLGTSLYGTGRAVGVIKDILSGKGLSCA